MAKTLIFYGTLTGNTEMVAEVLHKQLVSQFPDEQFDLSNVRDISFAQITEYNNVIFGTSTWDDFGNPDTEEFLEKLKSSNINFAHQRFAFFGLGDSTYHNFCGAVTLAQDAIAQRQGVLYEPIFTIDGYPEDEVYDDITQWATKFLHTS